MEKNTYDNATDEDIRANYCSLSLDALLANINKIAAENGIDPLQTYFQESRNACIEMETGTGKTLTYLQSAYELYKEYGLTKFIVLVPSIPIRQGGIDTFENFKTQLEDKYDFTPNTFVYDSSKLREENIELSSLKIGGIAVENKNTKTILANNNNYQYFSQNSLQEYDFDGSIEISNKITVASDGVSAIGGVVARNNGKIGRNNEYGLNGEGFAVNIIINAPSINNVGGVAGINNGEINNSLVVANISAKNNVGGVVGQNGKTITNAIVELYQNSADALSFDTIQGNENVGGVVGYANKQSLVQYSYTYSYEQNCKIKGDNYVGGIIGYAEKGHLLVAGNKYNVVLAIGIRRWLN